MVPKNGVIEHMNRTILERAQSMQIFVGLPKQFWTDAVNTAMYLVNRRPSVPLNYGILEKTWTDEEVNLNHLRTFGCISYVYIELSNRSTLNSKFKRCIFIGYKTHKNVYRFCDPENRKILKHKDVVFNEQKMYIQRELPQRMISGWHLRARLSSRALRTQSSSNMKMLPWTRLATFSRGM